MTKISKGTKLKAIIAYLHGKGSYSTLSKKYDVSEKQLKLLVAAYKVHGAGVLFNPPQVTGGFRINLVEWAIEHSASYTQIAAKFNYIGMQQIRDWKQIYLNEGPNGLLSIQKGRNSHMASSKKNRSRKSNQSEHQKELHILKGEVLRLQIENEALKLLASMTQQTDNSQE